MTLNRTLELNNGTRIPVVGFGCAFGSWTGGEEMQGFRPEESWRPLTVALESGYTHFDCAYCYGTERHLGDVLGRGMAEGKLRREDVFVTTKLAHPATPPHVAISHRLTWNWRDEKDLRQRVRDDFDRSKEKLGLGYVDLLLMHWPGDFDNQDREFAKEARLAIWDVFESFVEKGEARAIGVCNFGVDHLRDLIDSGMTVPAVNQVEIHPYCQDPELEAFCKDNGIVMEAYAPFASGAFGLLQDPVLESIANETGRSVGQVILRWHLQLGRIVLPKSASEKRIPENLDLFDFELSEEQVARINSLAPVEPKRTTTSPDLIV